TFAGASTEAVKILLSHRPAIAREAAKHGVSLQLSWHTHGGMIRGMDLLVARFNGGFVAGHYQVGALQLYVSRGSGIWNGFPVRIGVPAEITLLHLCRKAS
ncbi:MAG: metallophosphoesterase, partial [Deltaproteobacteria bacterium]|nr:metallophosphoesterase [Deltaproteobacteria bacterium]